MISVFISDQARPPNPVEAGPPWSKGTAIQCVSIRAIFMSLIRSYFRAPAIKHGADDLFRNVFGDEDEAGAVVV